MRSVSACWRRRLSRGGSWLPMILTVALFAVWPRCASAVPLNVSSGAITINTDALSISGAASATGTLVGGVAEFTFDSISLTGGGATTVTLTGSRPLRLLSSGNITIGTTLDASGFDGTPNPANPPVLAPGGLGRLGGGDGGDGGQSFASAGSGIGGGGFQTECCAGGGGGAFGGDGGSATSGVGAGGTAYGTLDLSTLLAGSGGGGGPHGSSSGTCCSGGGGGGAGGGAIELFSEFGSVIFNSGAVVNLDGGDGLGARSGGGGAGGGLKIDANIEIDIDGAALLTADGGNSTSSGNRAGGGGGGGRIALLAPLLDLDGTTFAVDTSLPSGLILSALGGGFTGAFGAVGLEGSIEFFATEPRPVIPEPSSIGLLGLGCLGLIVQRRRRIKK